ncbi:MAG: cache domain-containing protein [bacterium]|nr:cache domain-containing protein [bacterium]
MVKIFQNTAVAAGIAIAALIVALIALFSPLRESSPGGGSVDPASVGMPRQPGATVDFVQAAIDFYDSEGRQATLGHYNTPDSADGENYLFILDENGVLIAHLNQELLGRDVHTSFGVDVDGNRFGLLMLEATAEGMWIDYVYLNPHTGFRELKHSWVVRHDGLIFGSGWYELQRPSIVEFV